MQSISEVFDAHPNLRHLAVFRCKLRADKRATYLRNRRWLAEGKTGYWRVSEARELDGLVILIDTEQRDGVEVWLGLGVERLKPFEKGRWVLGTRGQRSFKLLGRAEVGLNEFVGKQLRIGATYVDADEALDGPTPRRRRSLRKTADRVVPFEVGHVYRRRDDISEPFKAVERGVISTSRVQPLIFLFSGSSGPQDGGSDGWQDDGTFAFAGEGQDGDQQFKKGNSAVRDHAKDGKDLLVFEPTKGGRQRYLGSFSCAGWETRSRTDKTGAKRNAIVFTLVPSDDAGSDDQENDHKAPDKRSLSELRKLAQASAAATNDNPKTSLRKHYERSIAVKAYVLKRANGICEACEQPAPFKRKNGTPYLEPHHIRRLSDGGPDDIRFVGGICPTCHRRVHHGADGKEWNAKLGVRIGALEATGESDQEGKV